MLGKLIKHEWKAVGKILAIVHLALILMAIVGKIMLSIQVLSEAGLLWRMLLLIYVFSVIAVGVGTHIYLAIRFYKNMYTDEGYLSFTLPVKSWQHIFFKNTGIFYLDFDRCGSHYWFHSYSCDVQRNGNRLCGRIQCNYEGVK
jgi:hypothetical protein